MSGNGKDRDSLELESIKRRASRVTAGGLVGEWSEKVTGIGFVDKLPDILAVRRMRVLAAAIADARESGAQRVLMYGGHVIKCGLGPLLARWLREGFFSSLATNGAGTIHDLELTLFGSTSEDVEAGIRDGSFGMWEETAQAYAGAVARSARSSLGLGEALGLEIADRSERPSRSLLGLCVEMDAPVTVHPALGGDITHPYPGLSWPDLAAAAERDFDLLIERCRDLGGGVVVNVGSAVVLPEVFLKALTTSRNLYGRPEGFTAADFDMIKHYRPEQNVVGRPTRALAGTAVSITGHHELMLPVLDLFLRAEVKRR